MDDDRPLRQSRAAPGVTPAEEAEPRPWLILLDVVPFPQSSDVPILHVIGHGTGGTSSLLDGTAFLS